MTAAVKDLLDTLGRLSVEERADVACHLLESLDEPDDSVAASWDAEVARRLAEVEEGRVEGRSAEEVFARLRDLWILAVAHNRRRPVYWLERRPG